MQQVRIAIALLLLTASAVGESSRNIVLENPLFRYTISAKGKNISFEDRATRTNYLRLSPASPCAIARVRNRDIPVTAASLAGGRLTLKFGSDLQAVLRVTVAPSCIVLSLESVTGNNVDALTFLNIPLSLKGSPNEAFGACAHSLNLFTRVDALPALQRDLRASCEKRFGLTGAKVAIVAAPMPQILPMLRETLARDSELPVCKVAGPWAQDIAFNRGSYLFNFGSLTETNLDDWIGMARNLGFTQIDNHGGGKFFRFGDMALNRSKWPDGWETCQRIVAKLHTQEIGSIFHTYAFFIDKQSKYVTPVPDPRLDAFRTFTLAKPVAADSTEIAVNESTAGMSTITGFFEHNSVVLHIGDELATFGGFTTNAPWKFTGVKRGELGTKADRHNQGTKARHLKECFGLFVPNPESALFEEIAANHADVVNRCGFDGIYLDAIDGSSILRGEKEAWFWASKFVVEIQKRLQKPVGMEMSSMWHHFWQYRTRWQAWDYPQRGHKRFIDQHAADVNGGLLLPLHLGWWSFQTFNPPQIEPSYPDVMETLAARLVGWDAGISLTAGVDRDTLRNTPLFVRAVDVLRTCEELRRSNALDETTKIKLREPGTEFTLIKNDAGKAQFRRIHSQSQTVASAEPWTRKWIVTNGFADQPAKFRIETLMAADPDAVTNTVILADFSRADLRSWRSTNAEGVSCRVLPAKAGSDEFFTFVARNKGKTPRNASWSRLEKRFQPLRNLKDCQALSFEVKGDGSGALLAVRLESPIHLSFGAVADRYVTLDFTGRRRFTLVETDSTRWSDYVWNDGKGLYNVYRETINFGSVESVSIWLQNLAPSHETQVRLGRIRAVPLSSVNVTNPKLTVGGQTIEFPVVLSPGSWIEANGPVECSVFGPKGEPLGMVSPRGQWPLLRSGTTTLFFSCDAPQDTQPRGRVTVFSQGEAL